MQPLSDTEPRPISYRKFVVRSHLALKSACPRPSTDEAGIWVFHGGRRKRAIRYTDSICRPGPALTPSRTRCVKCSTCSHTNGAFSMNAVLFGVVLTSRRPILCVLSVGSKILRTGWRWKRGDFRWTGAIVGGVFERLLAVADGYARPVSVRAQRARVAQDVIADDFRLHAWGPAVPEVHSGSSEKAGRDRAMDSLFGN